MEALALAFTTETYAYAQVERHGRLAIYTRTHKATGDVRYDLIVLRPNRESAHEAYPTAAEWGRLGWTYQTLAEARRGMELQSVLA